VVVVAVVAAVVVMIVVAVVMIVVVGVVGVAVVVVVVVGGGGVGVIFSEEGLTRRSPYTSCRTTYSKISIKGYIFAISHQTST